MSPEAPHNLLTLLEKRAEMLSKSRTFFAQRNVLEVDTPHISSCGSVDLYIDLLPVQFQGKQTYYLNSSPEYCMKRLLAQGSPDLYQLAHVFRDDEHGQRHNPEFTMCEWYRKGISFQAMIDETIDYIQLFLGQKPVEQLTYREVFMKYLKINPLETESAILKDLLLSHHIPPLPENDIDPLLGQLLTCVIEPMFPKDHYTVLTHYPVSQGELAVHDGQTAERFEVYAQGYELANGYHENADPELLRYQFEQDNATREKMGKPSFPIDEAFIASLQHLPDCCGVAVGFDRLIMLSLHLSSIDEALAFSWDHI